MASRVAFYRSRALVQTCRLLGSARKAETPPAPSLEVSSSSGRSGGPRKPASPSHQRNRTPGARGKSRSDGDAIKRLERAKRGARGATPKLYTSAISTYGKQKQWRKAIDLLREMSTKGVAPNVITYEGGNLVCGGEKQKEGPKDLLQEKST